MKTWLAHHLASLSGALRRLLRTPFATGFTALAIGVAISLPIGLYLVVQNLNHLAGNLPAQPEISLFLSDQATARERDAMQRQQEEADATVSPGGSEAAPGNQAAAENDDSGKKKKKKHKKRNI